MAALLLAGCEATVVGGTNGATGGASSGTGGTSSGAGGASSGTGGSATGGGGAGGGLACLPGEKVCGGVCVGVGDPAYGCSPTACAPCPNAPHGAVACAAGACAVGACDAGFADCDGNMLTGCEVDASSDPANCGACAHACAGMESCVAGACTLICPTGTADCNQDPTDGCETILGTSTDCAACGDACAVPHGGSACAMGACVVLGCDPGWSDCDGDPANGCERDLTTDPQSCGACGHACGSPPNVTATACSGGACTITSCPPGRTDCNGLFDDGCETNGTTCACPAPPVGSSGSLADCNAGLDPTKAGGDLLWTTASTLTLSPCLDGVTGSLAAVGPTGDIALSTGCYTTATIHASLLRYNAFGAPIGSFVPWSGGTGSFFTSASFDPGNHLLALFERWYGGPVEDTFIVSPGKGFYAYGSGLDLFGSRSGDALGNFFFVSNTGTPVTLDTTLTLPAPGAYLVRGGAMGESFQAGWSGSYTPDGTGGILRFGALAAPLDVGCGAMTPPSAGSGYLARIDASWGCTYSHVLPAAPSVVAAPGGGALVSATGAATVDLGCGPLAAAPGGSTFVTRLDGAGACVFGAALPAPGLKVAIDANGRVLVSGTVGATPIDLGGGPLPPLGSADFVLAELDPTGQHLWSRRFGGPNVVFANPRIVIAPTGDVYLKTAWTGTVDLGGGPITAAAGDTVVASFSLSGAHRWSRVFHFPGKYQADLDGCGALVVATTDQSFNPGCGEIVPPPTTDIFGYARPYTALARFAP